MSHSTVITLDQINKVYANGTVALQNMNLEIASSEFISLVGPSGCGKSTVLRMIAGLGKMTSGDIRWSGHRSQHKLAYVFQEAALMPWATVLDNVCLPLKLEKMPRRSAIASAKDALALVGLQGFERCFPRELSGGMKMRVSIARALVTQPDVLLMDEPFGALDEMTRSRLNQDLLNLWTQMRWTVIFVTHNIYEAVYLSNRVIVMAARPGRAIADIAINESYPRCEDFRVSPQFSHYCREVSHALSEATLNMQASPDVPSYRKAIIPV
jgi:NitT/TauT family transport system ATP-binding protein